jgi:hypothetical protein
MISVGLLLHPVIMWIVGPGGEVGGSARYSLRGRDGGGGGNVASVSSGAYSVVLSQGKLSPAHKSQPS